MTSCRPQPRSHRPERVRQRGRPVDRRQQPIEETLDRGPHPWEFRVFGRQRPPASPYAWARFSADAGQPPFDPLQPSVRIGQPACQPGGDEGSAVGDPRRGVPAQADRRRAHQGPATSQAPPPPFPGVFSRALPMPEPTKEPTTSM